jgi:hypothetical protein
VSWSSAPDAHAALKGDLDRLARLSGFPGGNALARQGKPQIGFLSRNHPALSKWRPNAKELRRYFFFAVFFFAAFFAVFFLAIAIL